MTEIAIIVATYNGEEYLREQLDSILSNTYRNIRIHICDDGSTDSTLSIAREYEADHPGQVFAEPNAKNLGVRKNFLYAAKRIEADYYMFCDQDDVWLEDKIEKSLAFIQKTENGEKDVPCVIFGDVRVVDAELHEIAPSFQKRENLSPDKLKFEELLIENKLIGCTVMFNRALRDKITECPEDMKMHDWWVGLIGAAFGRVAYLDCPLLLYRQHGTNTFGSAGEIGYILQNLNKLGLQRQMLYDICRQAGAFLSVYRDDMSEHQIYMAEVLSRIPGENWVKRRCDLFGNQFFKTGLLRNIGDFVIL